MTTDTKPLSMQAQKDWDRKIHNKLYAMADVIGATLYQSAQYKDEWLTCSPQQVQLGPWSVTMPNSAWSDEIDPEGCSMFVKMKGELWGYVMHETGKLRMVLFNGKDAGISRNIAATFGSRVIATTMTNLEPFVVAWFVFDVNEWKEVKKEEF
jgi:hypothetical protein